MLNSRLHNEHTFYRAFLRDLDKCREEIIIESPYITVERMRTFAGIFKKLIKAGVRIYIVTRDPKEHDRFMEPQSEDAIRWCETVGIQVFLCTGNHHRKLAILDRSILWEGSLNILSQAKSKEIMRRIEGQEETLEMLNFLKLGKYLIR